nr:hypothetical protein [Tanacetum cinerariifolium]
MKKSSGFFKKGKRDLDSDSFDDEGNAYFEEALVVVGIDEMTELVCSGLRRRLISLGDLEKEGYTVKMQMGRIKVSNDDDVVAQRQLEDKQREKDKYGLLGKGAGKVVRPKIEDNDNFKLKGQFLKELRTNTFSGSNHEDANEHIEKFLKIVDLFHIPNITIDQVMLRAFHMPLIGAEVVWFYNGLYVPTRQILNSRGAIPSKTAADAKVAIQEMAEYSQKWHSGTSRTRSTKTFDGLAAIQAQLNNLGRETKKVNEKVYVAQVGCEKCKGPHYNKDFPLKEEGKTLEEAYYDQFGASIKTIEIQIGKMSKVLQERGFGSLPSSTETNHGDHVKSISTIIEADASSIHRYWIVRVYGFDCDLGHHSRLFEGGGKGRGPRGGNDERVDELNGQGNDQGLRANGNVEGVNKNVEGVNEGVGGASNFSTIIAQQLQNLLPVILAQDMSGCSIDQKVKYTAGSFVGKALTWWNSQIRMLSQDFIVHELARLVPHLVTLESRKIERYAYDLALQIREMAAATEPKTIQKAVQISGALT